jgi:hypothetical protein
MADYVLEILDGESAGSVVPLGKDPVQIGRRPENDLVLADEKVSGKHAQVVFEDGRYVLRDLESTNGTLLDGRAVEEVVLTGQDLFQIGRIRISFHLEGEEAGADLRLHRVSAEAITRSGRSSRWLMVLIGLLVLGGGALYYNLNVGPGPIRRSLGAQQRRPLSVPGNRIQPPAAACEGEGWELRVAGDGFAYGSLAYTGSGALEAVGAQNGTGFSLARLSVPVQVRGALIVTGYLRTEGEGQIGIRLRFTSSLAEEPLTFTTGIQPASYTEYERVQWAGAVPPEMDLAQIELLALLPSSADAAFVDDLAIVEAGEAQVIDLRAGGRAIGTGASLAFELVGEPVVLGMRPGVQSGPLVPVAAAGIATLSDAGMNLEVEIEGETITVALRGGSGVMLDLPAGVSQGMLSRRDDQPFQRWEEGVEAKEFLLIARTGRVLLGLTQPRIPIATPADSGMVLTLPGIDALKLRMSFAEERDLAATELGQARAARGASPGEALDHLQRVLDFYPHDSEREREALELRAALVARRGQRVEELRESLETAMFFRTSGGLIRVKEELEELVENWDGHLEERESIDVMRAGVDEALVALQRESVQAHRNRLDALATILEENGQDELARMVREYLNR